MNHFTFTQRDIKIGATIDTKPLYYVQVKDIDESIIPVPYRNSEITIRKLIENYEEITNCKKIAMMNGQQKDRVYFMILQGYYKGNIAKDQFELSSMDLSFDKPCFQVVDHADNESIQVTQSKLIASEQSSMVQLKVKYNQDTYKVVINSNEKVMALKNQLKERLSLNSVDNIQINFQNIILINSNKISHYKGLVNGSEIAVVLCCKTQNSFRQGTMITTANNGQIAIQHLKAGTKIISFDTNQGKFVEDEVSMIKKQFVSEEIKITLEDETVIEATPNHLFLCSDRRYRKYQIEINSEPLKVGDTLLQVENKESSIKSLEFKYIQPAEQFYYFFLKKGNNFVANKTIAYNVKGYKITCQIDYGKKHGDQLSFRSEQSIKNIKKALQMRYQQHHALCMKIIYSGRQIVDQSILSEYSLGKIKEPKLIVTIKEESDYIYFHPDTEIIFEADQKKKIRDILKQEDRRKVQFSNRKCFLLASSPDEKKVSDFYKITFEEGEEIFVSRDTFLEMENGQVKISHELFELFNSSQNKLYLKKVGGQTVKIVKMHRIHKNAGQLFYKIQIQQQNHLVISPSITVYSFVIFFSYNQSTIAFGINKKTTIIAIKQKLSALYKQHVRTLHFYYSNKELINETTFCQNQIKMGDLVQVTTSDITQSMIHQPQKSKETQLQIQLKITQSHIYKISYEKFKDKTVQQIMKYLIPSYRSSFFFLYGRLIILPTDKLQKIQTEFSFQNSEEVIVSVIKNQKLSFVMNMNLKGSQIHNISFIFTENQSQISLMSIDQDNKVQKVESSKQYRETQERIRKSFMPEFYKQEKFYRPFLYFFDPDFREEMRKYMQNFSSHLEQQQGGNVFKMIKSLYINLIYLPNHISRSPSETYFGVRNFKFSSHFDKNDTFYLYEYLLTSNDQESVKAELKNNHGTLFRLASVTGKRINDFSVNQQKNMNYLELLFPPYTYFLVDKVVRHQCYDEVWISEISTPWTLQKDIILWVDDNPINNVKQMEKIMGKKDLQILPLTSTLQARKWLKEFGWLMTWKGINFKLISDMHRQEYNQVNDEKQSNPTAGFQLIQKIYDENDGDIKVCIYCGDKKRTEALLKNDPKFEKIRPKFQEKSFRIQQREPKILDFCYEE